MLLAMLGLKLSLCQHHYVVLALYCEPGTTILLTRKKAALEIMKAGVEAVYFAIVRSH